MPVVLEHTELRTVAYAVLSLTVVRMLPVALALLGTGLPAATVAFIGWFGPRGLASIIFAMLALDDLTGAAIDAVSVIGLTVLLSVFSHGLSAKPLANRYAASAAARGADAETHRPLAARGLMHRHAPETGSTPLEPGDA